MSRLIAICLNVRKNNSTKKLYIRKNAIYDMQQQVGE